MAEDDPPYLRQQRTPADEPSVQPNRDDARSHASVVLVTIVDRGSFTSARCACGWTGPGRRSRNRAREDGAEHVAAFHADL